MIQSTGSTRLGAIKVCQASVRVVRVAVRAAI